MISDILFSVDAKGRARLPPKPARVSVRVSVIIAVFDIASGG